MQNSMTNKFGLFSILLCLVLVGCGGNVNSSNVSNDQSNLVPNTTNYEVISKKVSRVKTKENKSVDPFNTEVILVTYCGKDFNDIYPCFNEEIQRLHILFDRYNDFVDEEGKDIINLKKINESYGTGNVLTVDQDLIDLLNLSIELSILTEGYFNPTLGELSDTWNYIYEDGEKYVRFSPYCFEEEDPKEEDVISSKEKSIPCQELSSYLLINDENNTIEFKKYKEIDKITLSLGAIAKGYAIEKTKKIVETFNVPAMVDGGSSSSYGIGTNPNPDRDYWSIGIASPYKDAFGVKAIANVKINGTYAMSVSGDYESCYKTQEGKLRHHILNPYSGYPENYYRVISLKGTARSDVLDGLSTALFSIESIDKINEVVDKVESYYNIEIALMLEKEVDKEKRKIDVYLSQSYDDMVMKFNSSYFNSKIIV